MAVRIPGVGTPVNVGEVELKSEDWNDSFEYLIKQTTNSYRQSLLNLIRQLEDRSISFSADGGEWAEAYTSASGRLSSVDTGTTSAIWELNKKYIPIFTKTGGVVSPTIVSGQNSGGWTNTANSFDGDEDTYATYERTPSGDYAPHWAFIGQTFAAQYVDGVSIIVMPTQNNASYVFSIQTYDGSTWSTVESYLSLTGDSVKKHLITSIKDTIQGVRVYCSMTGLVSSWIPRYRVYEMYIATTYTSSNVEITHSIPPGTFKDNISTCIGVPKLVDYEDGASVQYKLTNATEDSGWLDANTVSSFTAFTSEPTKCVVKLIPKTTSPTPGYPSISGFGFIGGI